MTPIEKNIIVVDEQGNEYEATYPKRAKGLVKNGRARFIDENTICLACPPSDNILEDNKMSAYNENSVTKKEIFEQIKQLQNQLVNIKEVLVQMNFVDHVFDDDCDYNIDIAKAKIDGMTEVFASREQTIQKMLQFYIDLYSKADAETPAE